MDSPSHLYLPFTLQFPNQSPIPTYAMIDSSASRSFVSSAFLTQNCLSQQQLPSPITAYAVDGRTLASGPISHQSSSSLHVKSHSEIIVLLIAQCPFAVILGIDWLKRHNPFIDWVRDKLKLSCCAPITEPPTSILGTGSGRIQLASASLSASTPVSTVGLVLGRTNCLHPQCP